MPVCLETNTQNHDLGLGATGLRRKSNGYHGWSGPCVNIGLINNMPDAALEATERQFVTLLDSASDGVLVRLSFYALPDVPRNDWGRHWVKRFYFGLENLWTSEVDGLIVTGREPRTPNLKDEPYWNSLTQVLEWADDNTHSTVWSCLAAHAALLHMDGIARRKSEQKRCGIFDCVRLSDHPLLAGLSSRFQVPHSRWNDIPEDDLAAAGYSVLSRVQGAGADTIIKHNNSLFVFFQGHPEYESDTLLYEYRRDVKRYLTGETNTYPTMPHGYFDRDTQETLAALQEKATRGRRENCLPDLAAALEGKTMPRPWSSTAARLYGNWLRYITAQREAHQSPTRVTTNAHR